ncbi:MAG: hypothetical protein Q8N42_00295 [bacterium]|nr:hypothetical protein [bacterium]
MKKMAMLLSFLAVLCLALAGCVTEFYIRAPFPVVIVEEDGRVYYDDPVRGWFIEGYWNGGIWIAPFWTTDIFILHRHFNYYRGGYRGHMENHFNRYPERFRGHQGPGQIRQPQGPGRHQIERKPDSGHQQKQIPPRNPPKNPPKKNPKNEHRK